MTKKSELAPVWHAFIASLNERAEKSGFPQIEKDPQWPSPCEFEQKGQTFWKPVLQSEVLQHPNSFDNVGHAMDIEIDQQYAEFFSLYFAAGIDAVHERGPLHLLQAWSQDDFERLQQNLIGHLMMKQKLKQEPTLFFALTDEEDLNVVVNNQSGEVCLEYVGKEPHATLAPDLASFIKQCKLAEQ